MWKGWEDSGLLVDLDNRNSMQLDGILVKGHIYPSKCEENCLCIQALMGCLPEKTACQENHSITGESYDQIVSELCKTCRFLA